MTDKPTRDGPRGRRTDNITLIPGHGGPRKGAGWGGPAKGSGGRKLSPKGDAYSDAARALAYDPKHQEAKAPLRELAMKTWIDVMQTGESEAARVTAAEKMLDRIDGKAIARVETTGADGGPLEIKSVDPIEAAREYQRLINGA